MKKAFTMLEFLIVLLIIGILSVAIVPSMKSNKLREAAVQVVSHIKYTQHLAMVDDQFDTTTTDWYKKRWQIIFANYTHKNPTVKTNVAYSIFSDTSLSGKPDLSEIAKDTSDLNSILSGGHSNLDDVNYNDLNAKLSLSDTYGVIDYDLKGGCSKYSNSRISFDHFGRPMFGDISSMDGPYEDSYNRLVTEQCLIVLSTVDDSITIAVEPETGYAHILD